MKKINLLFGLAGLLFFANVRGQIGGNYCNNTDFESITSNLYAPAAIQGWSLQSGINYNSCTTPTYNATNNYTVFSGPVFDPNLNQTISSYFDDGSANVFSGNSFIRINDPSVSLELTKLSKKFIANGIDTLFQYAFIAVMNGGPHDCCEQQLIIIKVTVTNTLTNISTVLSCPYVSITTNSPACSNPLPSTNTLLPGSGPSGWSYLPWTAYSINLKPYLNHQVEIEVIAKDCNQGGHHAYIYFDARCGNKPVNTYLPGNLESQNGNNVNYISCTSPATLFIQCPGCPLAGPGPTMFYTPPLLTTYYPGAYTLSVLPGGFCLASTKTININITTPNVIISSSRNPICVGETVGLSASGSHGFIWNTGDTTASININPIISSNYSVSSVDSNNCKAVNFKTIYVYVCESINATTINEKKIKLFPNPNKGEFILDIGENMTKGEIIIQDCFGQTIQWQAIQEGENVIKVNAAAGIYYYILIENKIPVIKGKLRIQ